MATSTLSGTLGKLGAGPTAPPWFFCAAAAPKAPGGRTPAGLLRLSGGAQHCRCDARLAPSTAGSASPQEGGLAQSTAARGGPAGGRSTARGASARLPAALGQCSWKLAETSGESLVREAECGLRATGSALLGRTV